MSWEEEVREIRRRRHLAKQQGGKDGIAKQHARGRLTIRERIDALLDDGSFQEQGLATAIPDYDDDDRLLGYVPANYVVGFGRIDGRRVVVGGEDFTLKGGSPNSTRYPSCGRWKAAAAVSRAAAVAVAAPSASPSSRRRGSAS